MQVIKHEPTAVARIAACMYNFETGRKHFDEKGNKIPTIGKRPHAPFPVITIPSKTTKGKDITVQYRPTVGIVFYTAGPGFDPMKLAFDLRTELAKFNTNGDHCAHLGGFRATDVSPCTTLRKNIPISDGTVITQSGAQQILRQTITRQIIIKSVDDLQLPSYISKQSAFTWVIMNAGGIVNVGCYNMITFNALSASVIYDHADAISGDSVKVLLTASDIKASPVPENIKKALTVVGNGWFMAPQNPHVGVLIEAKTGEISIVGNRSTLGGGRTFCLPSTFRKWDDLKTTNRDFNELNCGFCHIPLANDVIVVMQPLQHEPNTVNDIYGFTHYPPGSKIIGDRGFAVCLFCYISLPTCIVSHLRCDIIHSRIERTQIEAFKGNTTWEKFIPLISEKAVRIKNLDCFIVGGKFILASDSVITRQFVELGYADIISHKLPIITFGSIAVRT